LTALARQTVPAFEIIVVHPDADDESSAVVAQHPGVLGLTIGEHSLVRGMMAGAAATIGDIICFTDDDAEPLPDWISRISAAFSSPSIGGVGGRDLQAGVPPVAGAIVGTLGSWGKLRGNHHVGIGAARDVDVLKGVNMAYRRTALALPRDLRGAGAEAHNEVAIGQWARAHDWRLVYDPSIAVRHAVAPRASGAARTPVEFHAAGDAAFNLTYAILSLHPDLRLRRGLYGLLIGDRGCPGLVSSLAGLALGDSSLAKRLLPTLVGQIAAITRVLCGRPLVMRPLGEVGVAPDEAFLAELAREPATLTSD